MHVAQLGEMGFGRRRATMALELTGGNMQRATALLLSGELDAIAPGLEDDDGLSSSGSSLAGSEDGDDGSPRAAPPADHAAAARGFVFGEGGQEARPRLVAEGRRPRSPPRAPRAPVAAGLRRAESPPRARRAPVTDEAVTQIVRSRTIVFAPLWLQLKGLHCAQVELGFSREAATTALAQAEGNVPLAIELLM